MDQTWLGKAEARGFKKGEAVGEAQATKKLQAQLGRAEAQSFKKGMSEGKAEVVDQLRRLVLKRIEQRFGPVPDPIQAKVRSITSMEALVKLLEKVPSLQSVEDLRPRRNGRPKSAA
jgi:hypothetical protein